MYDIIIIGAGPAGLSAAIYGQRAGKKTLVLEQKQYGGQIVVTPEIENYPGISKISGFEFATSLYEQAKGLGAEIRMEQVIEVGEDTFPDFPEAEIQDTCKFVRTTEAVYSGKTLIIATGVTKRKLGLEDEQRLVGAGVSYCATCDGMFFRGKDVAVNGGGNTALEDALFLSNYCNQVYVIHRRDEFRGEKKLQEALKKRENVKFILDSQVTALYGQTVLEAVTIQNMKTKEEQRLDINGLFVAIGQEPDSDIFASVINLDEYGYIVADENCRTNVEGIFVAGDCRTKNIRQLTTATADGTVAALAACEYIG